MAKYLIKNIDSFRLASFGRLRWRPGQQMWVDGEVFSHRRVQSLIESGQLSVLQASGLPEPEVPEVEPEVEEVVAPEPEPEVEAPEVEERPVEESEEVAPALTYSDLSSKRVAELRDLASSMDIPWAGLRKAELIDAILGGEE